MIDFNINELLFLNDSLAHKIDDQIETIKYLQDKNKKLQRDINDLQSELAGATNDYKQATNEIKLLNNQTDKLIAENKNLRRNIEYLCDENVRIRHEVNEVKNNVNNY